MIILLLIRRDFMHTRYALWWLPTALAVAILGVFPRLSDFIAAKLGIGYPPILPVIVGLGLILIKLLTMDLERSKNERKLHRLAQRVAILESKMDKDTG